jgi:hypothetical protein
MSVTFRTIGFPTHLFRIESSSFRLTPVQITSGAALSGFVRASGLVSMLWNGRINLAAMTDAQGREFESFIARLSGQAVLFEIPAPQRALPIGAAAGFASGNPAYPVDGVDLEGVKIVTGSTTCLVRDAAPRYASAIMLKGLVPDTLVLRPGDTFVLGGNLYMVSGKVRSDGNGEARVAFDWRLHRPARAGDIVSFRRARVRVQLKAASEGEVERDTAGIARGGFAFTEVPYAA